MSEKTFKVGDRVRITSTRPSDYGVASINDAPQWVSEMSEMLGKPATVRKTEDGPFVTVSVDGYSGRWCWLSRDLQLLPRRQSTEQPRRLPQVGEVWRSRSGTFTVKIGRVQDEGRRSLGYTICGKCSDGVYRDWGANGTFDRMESDDSASDIIELVEEAPQEAEVSVAGHQVEEPPQKRLPRVGEVWRSRDGRFTTNPLGTPIHDAMTFCAVCSDGVFRTWTESGAFHFGGVIHDKDLVELVSEAHPESTPKPEPQPEPTPEPTPELEVSVEIVPFDPTTTELHQAIEDPVERFDAINLAVIQDAISGKRGQSQLLIAREILRFGSLLCRKNNDYGDSAWKPPRLAPGCDAGTAIRVRMSDKLERIESLLTRSQEVKDESIDDTLRDLAAYILLDLARPGRSGVEAK